MQQPVQSTRGKGYFALIITSFCWGTTWVASKMGISEIPALQMAAIRQLIAGTIFVTFFLFYKKLPLPNGKQFVWLGVMALLMFVSANGLSTWSLKYIPTGLSALIGALYPLSVVVIERVFFKSKKITPLTFLGFVLGLGGIIIVFYENAFNQHSPYFFVGALLSFIAMLSWSFGTVFIARNKVNLNPYYAIGWQMILSAVVLFICAKAAQPMLPLHLIPLKAWLVILYLVGVGSVISFIAFIYSMNKLPVTIASLYAYINPLVAMVLASFLVNEKLTANIFLGAVVTLTGVFLVNYSIKKNREKIITEAEI
ncbi:MAG: EamA family transporter [Ferruginibacter sp.]